MKYIMDWDQWISLSEEEREAIRKNEMLNPDNGAILFIDCISVEEQKLWLEELKCLKLT